MMLYIVNHVKPNKSTEYIKIIKKKKNETIITILPRRDESQFDENRAPRRRATNGEQRTAMKVTVFGRYLDLEARSTAMEVAWRYFGSHLRPCHPSRRSQSHESPADLSSWWLSLRWVPEGWGAGSSARSGDWPGSAAIAAIAGIAAVAGTWRMECFSPRQRSQARRPVSFCPPVDAPKHRFRKVWRSRNVIFFFILVNVTRSFLCYIFVVAFSVFSNNSKSQWGFWNVEHICGTFLCTSNIEFNYSVG